MTRLGRPGWPALVRAAFVVALVVSAFLPIGPTDLDLFFWPSAQMTIGGHPFLAYQPGGQAAYPNANGPLGLVPLTAVGLMARRLGWLGSLHPRRALALAVFSFFCLLLAEAVVRAVERERGRRLGGRARAGVMLLVLAAPPLWEGVVGYGHVEQPLELWLLLAAAARLRAARAGQAGVGLGMAMLARTTAAFYAIPLVLLSTRRGWRGLIRLGAGAVVVVGAGLLPFWLADRADLVHSLVTYRAGLPIAGGSFWLPLSGGALADLGREADGLLALLAVALISVAVLLPGGRGEEDGWRLYGSLLAVACCFPMLAKTVWPYYVFDPYVFALVWWLAGGAIGWRAAVPAVLAGLCVVAELATDPSTAYALRAWEGVGSTLVLGAIAITATVDARRRTPEVASGTG